MSWMVSGPRSGAWRTASGEREKEQGTPQPSAWAYTPRYTWAEMEERFMAEDERDEVQTLIERWGP